MIKGEEATGWKDRKMSETMDIGQNEREGITEITVKTFDKAGNESNTITINIPKDTVKPNFEPNEVTIIERKARTLKVSARAKDPTPSSTVNGAPIVYRCYYQEAGTTAKTEVNPGTTNTSRSI